MELKEPLALQELQDLTGIEELMELLARKDLREIQDHLDLLVSKEKEEIEDLMVFQEMPDNLVSLALLDFLEAQVSRGLQDPPDL